MQALLPVFRSILLWTLACIVCIHAFGEPEKTAKSSAGKPRGTAVVMSACFFPEKHWNVSLMSYVHLESIEKPETLFTKSLGLKENKALYFNLPLLHKSQQFAVEMKLGQVSIAYADLNMNGKLDTGEKLSAGSGNSVTTPEFTLNRSDDSSTPYAFSLAVVFSGVKASPRCVWYGEGVLDGERVDVFIKDVDLSGFPGDSGKDRILIQVKTRVPGKRQEFALFSSIFKYRADYYKMVFDNTTSTLYLDKCAVKTGKLKVQLPLAKYKKTTISYAYVTGGKDNKLAFTIKNPKTASIELPAAEYSIPVINIGYKDRYGYYWSAFTRHKDEKRRIDVKAGAENILALGKPVFLVTAVEQKNRAKTPDAMLTECKQGDKLFLNIKLVGENGEGYFLLSRRKASKPPPPVLKILDPKGKEIANKSIEYGWEGSCGYSWNTKKVKPGKYTVVVSQNTGPFGGLVEGKHVITVK